MSVRLSTAVLLTGLALAAPVHAEGDPLSPDNFLGTYEAETVALIAASLAAASPIQPEIDLLNPEHFLDAQGAETAALIAAELTTAGPVYAEIDLFDPKHFLTSQEVEQTAALIAFDLAIQRGQALSQSSLDQPAPVTAISDSELTDLRSEPVAPVEQVNLAPAYEETETASLAPKLFLDRHMDETLARIAADFASNGELVTGSIVSGSAGSATPPVGQPIVGSLTDDALSFQEYLTP